MDENEDKTMVEELKEHVCDLIATLETMDPTTDEYTVVKDAIKSLSDIVIRIEETQMKYEDEVEKRHFEYEMKKLELEASREAREAENRIRMLEQKETKAWHIAETILKASAIGAGVFANVAFVYTALVQSRMNYVDNVYDSSPAAKMILNKIGKDLTIQKF